MNREELAKTYDESTERLTELVRNWLNRLESPYVPPELKTGLPAEVGTECFKQAVAYYALCNYGS